MNIIDNLWSWQFGAGVIAGFVLSRLMCAVRGRSIRAALAFDPRPVLALIGAVFLIWSVLTTQDNASENARIAAEAKTFAAAVQRCQAELIASIIGSRQVTTENDRLSVAEREALAEGQHIEARMFGELFKDTPDLGVLRADLARLEAINARVADIHTEQDQTSRARPALPDPQCGT